MTRGFLRRWLPDAGRLRANLAAAVLATFVSNPFTTPLILVGGYHVRAAVLRAPGEVPEAAPESSWLERIAAMGEPLLVGLLIVATATAALTYLSVILAWRFASMSRLRRRRNLAIQSASKERGEAK